MSRLSRSFWNATRVALLQSLYAIQPAAAIADTLGIKPNQVRAKAKNMRLRKNAQHRPWTAVEIKLLKEIYPDVPAKDLAALLKRELSSVHTKAKKLGLSKSDHFKASDYSGRVQRGRQDPRMVAHRFKPGIVPWNKGKHTFAGGRSSETRFKKGRPAHEAHNYVPIGTHKIDRDGYLVRKVTDDPSIFPARRWVGVHRLVWAEANGPIPEKHMVRFKPGQFTNKLEEITADRLELVSMAENARRNHWANHPHLKALVPLKTHITRQVNRIARQAKERVAA